jgi:uncharacterized membrane protein (DUF485 family)
MDEEGKRIFINAVFRNTTIYRNEFAWIGDTAIAAWGYLLILLIKFLIYLINTRNSSGIDGTGGNFPRYTQVIGNLIHEFGNL